MYSTTAIRRTTTGMRQNKRKAKLAKGANLEGKRQCPK